MSLGKIISTAREKVGLTQEQLGAYFRISDKAVSAWERDETKPTRNKELKLAEILGVPREVFEGEGKKVPKKHVLDLTDFNPDQRAALITLANTFRRALGKPEVK